MKGEGHVSGKLPTWVAVGAVGVCSALLATGVNSATKNQIEQHAAKAGTAVYQSVLQGADSFEPLETQASRYTIDAIYRGLNASGEPVGYVGQTTVTGYGGPVVVTAGVDQEGVVTGVDVGGSDFNETPGLGGFTKEKKFTDQFVGKTAGLSLNAEENGVEAVSGATISSSAVTGGVNNIVSYVSSAELGILEEQAEAYMGPTVSQTEQGFAGDVTVTVGFNDDGTIAYMDVQTPNETEGLGKLASEKAFTDQFIGKSGPFAYGEDGIEAVTGASFTSTAVINALNTIVEGGGTASEGPLTKTVQGFGGEVTVNVMLNADNSVAALSIDTPDETEGLGKMTSEPAFTDQFIGKSGPFAYGEDGIEAVTGATVTSTAVINALNELVPGGEAAPAAEPAAETEAESEAEAVDTEGMLSKTVQGFGGDVTVNVGLNDDNTVAALVIETPMETEGLGKMTSEKAFTDQFIGKAAPFVYGEDGIEAVTGATVTSTAVINALNELVPGGEAAVTEEAATETAAAEEAATEMPVVVGSLETILRARPVDSAPAAAEAPATEEAAAGDAEALMRERPAATAFEAPAAQEASEEAAESADTGDAEALMRQRPAATAFEAPAAQEAVEETAESAATGDAEALMRERPAATAFEALAAQEASEEAAEPAANGDAQRLMRPRPADSAFAGAGDELALAVGMDELSAQIADSVDISDSVKAAFNS